MIVDTVTGPFIGDHAPLALGRAHAGGVLTDGPVDVPLHQGDPQERAAAQRHQTRKLSGESEMISMPHFFP